VHGRSAHAGRNPEDGRNALLAAADLALRLAEAKGPELSVNPSRIEGGSPSNVVPDLAVLRVNLRPATPEDEQDAKAMIDAAVAEVAAATRQLLGQLHVGAPARKPAGTEVSGRSP
jgi:glutamate carboxypeptidase